VGSALAGVTGGALLSYRQREVGNFRAAGILPRRVGATLSHAHDIARANGVGYVYTGNVHDRRVAALGATAAARS
jgi:hypothetical protein